jgi:hypothetical protein
MIDASLGATQQWFCNAATLIVHQSARRGNRTPHARPGQCLRIVAQKKNMCKDFTALCRTIEACYVCSVPCLATQRRHDTQSHQIQRQAPKILIPMEDHRNCIRARPACVEEGVPGSKLKRKGAPRSKLQRKRRLGKHVYEERRPRMSKM